MNIIPIVPATLDLIQALNGGIRPALEDKDTFYVYRGEGEFASIISEEEFEMMQEIPEWMTIVKILYIGK